jgi:hypothetical protein
MGTPQISYPSGISLAIASNLSAAAGGADTFSGQLNTGSGTLSTVVSDVSVVVNEINTHLQGQFITALAGFWDGVGAIGSGGLGTGGVISDASRAMNFMDSLSGCMPGVSGNINDQLPAIRSGLSAISTVQANPNKEWKPEEASALQSQINGLVSALEAVNTALLSTASAIESAASGVKLGPGAVCASGVTIGEDPGQRPWKFNDNRKVQPQPNDITRFPSDGKTPTKTGGGGGNKPPGGKPPTTGGDEPPGGGEPWWKKFFDLRKSPDGKWRVVRGDGYRTPGLSNTVVNFINALISGGINYIVPTVINSAITTTEGVLLGMGGGFVAMIVASAFDVPELFLVATGASAITAVGGAMILKFTGLGKHGAPPTVQIIPVDNGPHKGDLKVEYKGETDYIPPSQLQQWLQQHGLAPSTATTSPSPAPTTTH